MKEGIFDGSMRIKNHVPIIVKGVMNDVRTINQYVVGKQIGKGGYGTVKLATHGKNEGKVAIKIIDKGMFKNTDMVPMGDSKEDELNKLSNEIKILNELDHNNVVKIQEVMEDERYEEIYIVMEFVEFGELISWDSAKSGFVANEPIKYFATTPDGFLKESEIRKIFSGIVSGLSYSNLTSPQ